jgi:hypothetical protein
VDVELSSEDDDVPTPKPNALVDSGTSCDDTRDGGETSVDPTAPNPISCTIAPPTSRRGCKHPPPANKRSRQIPQIDQVMTQVELAAYHGPHSPLDLFAIEIIFGCIFEAF